MNDKKIIKTTLIVLIISLFFIMWYVQPSYVNNYPPGTDNEWRLYKCVNGSIVNFTKEDILVCGGANPYLWEAEIKEKQRMYINTSHLFEK